MGDLWPGWLATRRVGLALDGQGLDLAPNGGGGAVAFGFEVVISLEVHPELRRRTQQAGQAESGGRSDGERPRDASLTL